MPLARLRSWSGALLRGHCRRALDREDARSARLRPREASPRSGARALFPHARTPCFASPLCRGDRRDRRRSSPTTSRRRDEAKAEVAQEVEVPFDERLPFLLVPHRLLCVRLLVLGYSTTRTNQFRTNNPPGNSRRAQGTRPPT